VLGLVSLLPAFSRFQDLASKNKDLQEKIQQLSLENKQLKNRQHKLQTDPIYAESVARKNLNVAKEGEVIYKVIPDKEEK